MLQLRRGVKVRESTAQQGEVIIGFEAAAGAVRGPFMFNQRGGGHDIEEAVWIGGAGRVAAVLGPGIGSVVLRPEAVNNEAEVFGAFGAAGVGVAEFGRPGEGEEIVIELSRLLGLGGEGEE